MHARGKPSNDEDRLGGEKVRLTLHKRKLVQAAQRRQRTWFLEPHLLNWWLNYHTSRPGNVGSQVREFGEMWRSSSARAQTATLHDCLPEGRPHGSEWPSFWLYSANSAPVERGDVSKWQHITDRRKTPNSIICSRYGTAVAIGIRYCKCERGASRAPSRPANSWRLNINRPFENREGDSQCRRTGHCWLGFL